MLVLRRCKDCSKEFSFNYSKREKRFCDICANKRRINSNKNYKQKHQEKVKAYQKDYWQRRKDNT